LDPGDNELANLSRVLQHSWSCTLTSLHGIIVKSWVSAITEEIKPMLGVGEEGGEGGRSRIEGTRNSYLSDSGCACGSPDMI
jgi:hypothetical protein